MTAALRLHGLGAAYGQSRVLDAIDLELPAGEAMALVGRNGAGKSTLLGSVMGLGMQAGGQVLLDGTDIAQLPPPARARLGLALVPQGRNIFGQLTVAENLQVGLAARGRAGRGLARGGAGVPGWLYELFPKLATLKGRRGGLLSGGEQQQLAIARALAGAPRILLLDEPTEGIQPNVVDEIEAALGRIRSELGIGLLLVEQNLGFAWRVTTRFAAMEGGAIVRTGLTADTPASAVAHLVHI